MVVHVVQELIESVPICPPRVRHNILPDLEEHDKGGLKFELCMGGPPRKANWFYSSKFNKVYIKIDDIISIDVLYMPKNFHEKYYVRVMLVYNSEVCEPVVRCENHSAKDPSNQANIKHSVLRCENPNVTYWGSLDGKNISDRLSALVPLAALQRNEDGFLKQTIALKFVCQNSCVGRRETSIVFFMENEKGEILAKKTTAVKICSCPKRDMKKDEGVEPSKKRTQPDACPMGKKIMKLEPSIKVEQMQPDEPEDEISTTVVEASNITATDKGVQLVLTLPNVETAKYVAQSAFNSVAGELALAPDNETLYSYMRELKKTLVAVEKLASGNQNSNFSQRGAPV